MAGSLALRFVVGDEAGGPCDKAGKGTVGLLDAAFIGLMEAGAMSEVGVREGPVGLIGLTH